MSRYFSLLRDETAPFEHIFLEAQKENFLKSGINPIDASRNMMFSVAMVAFHWKGAEGRDVEECCANLREMTNHMLYGVSEKAETKK